jgi:Flp pilus assembly protein TadD
VGSARRLEARTPPRTDLPMDIWKKLFGSEQTAVDYYREGVELLNAGKYHEALTSFRLAQRESPRDAAVLQQIAIAYTRIGMTDEAIKTYRAVLANDPKTASANYGLAFLLLRQGRPDDAETHLEAFLAQPPDGPEAARHVEHARETLKTLRDGVSPDQGEPGGVAPEQEG